MHSLCTPWFSASHPWADSSSVLSSTSQPHSCQQPALGLRGLFSKVGLVPAALFLWCDGPWGWPGINPALTSVHLLCYPFPTVTQNPAQAGNNLSNNLEEWLCKGIFSSCFTGPESHSECRARSLHAHFKLCQLNMHAGLQDCVAGLKKQHLTHLGLWDVKYIVYFLPNASLKAGFIVTASIANVWVVPWYMISSRRLLQL